MLINASVPLITYYLIFPETQWHYLSITQLALLYVYFKSPWPAMEMDLSFCPVFLKSNSVKSHLEKDEGVEISEKFKLPWVSKIPDSTLKFCPNFKAHSNGDMLKSDVTPWSNFRLADVRPQKLHLKSCLERSDITIEYSGTSNIHYIYTARGRGSKGEGPFDKISRG